MLGKEKTPPQNQNKIDANIGFEFNNHMWFGLSSVISP